MRCPNDLPHLIKEVNEEMSIDPHIRVYIGIGENSKQSMALVDIGSHQNIMSYKFYKRLINVSCIPMDLVEFSHMKILSTMAF